jgi:hypothetical protein
MQTAKNILKCTFFIIIALLLSTYCYFDNHSEFGYILTFLSIVTGFTITSLSIISISTFSKHLYNQEVPNDNSRTLLHQLVGKFEELILISVLTITLIFIFYFIEPITISIFKEYSIYNVPISIKKILSGSIWCLNFWTIFLFTKLLKMFSKFVVQSAIRNPL